MLQSILYGNGINRLTVNMPSWDQLIKEISDVELDNSIPNPLKYEALLMKKPYREPSRRLLTHDREDLITKDGKGLFVSGELTEKALKERIAKRLKGFDSNKIYEEIAKLPVTHFITTNYDNALFKSLGEGILTTRFRVEKIYSIRRNYVINSTGGRQQYYWPMHGSIDSPASIMLGFDHYCGSLAKIENYVKGNYELPDSRVESITKRLKDGITDIISWIDLFFVSDVHIIGLNLGYEETDLWWVLNKRRRIKQADPDILSNKVFYYPVEIIHDDIQQLLSSFDVEIVKPSELVLTRPFMERYKVQMKAIQNNLKTR